MRSLSLPALLLAIAAGALSCSGDSSPGDGDDGGGDGGSDDGGATACESDGDCAAWEICESQACEDGDRNNSVDEAQTLLWEDSASGYVNPSGDVDYYVFTAEGGEYVKITTTTDDDDSNTVLTLRSPDSKVHTASDGYPTGGTVSTYDSVIYAYLPDAGDYIIEVEDDGTYYSDADHETNGSPDYSYSVALSEWNQFTGEAETYEDPAVNLGIDAGSLYPVGVVIGEEDDTDYIGVTMPYSETGLSVAGVVDLSGSDLDPRVELWNEDGVLVSSLGGVGPDGVLYYPAMEEGDYRITVRDDAGGGGDDYWTFLFLTIGDEDSAYPSEVEPNDDIAFATDVSMDEQSSSSGTYTVGHAKGWADGPGDEDWYAFEAFDGGSIVACMNSAKWGSGIAPDIEIYDPAGELAESDSGNANTDPNAAIENVEATDGTWYMVVRAPEDADGALDEWYRITLYVAEFTIGSYSCP